MGWAKPGESNSGTERGDSRFGALSLQWGRQTAGPEINVLGNGTTIIDGDTTPSGADHTDFGSTDFPSGTVTRTFTIQNLGTASLTLNRSRCPERMPRTSASSRSRQVQWPRAGPPASRFASLRVQWARGARP